MAQQGFDEALVEDARARETKRGGSFKRAGARRRPLAPAAALALGICLLVGCSPAATLPAQDDDDTSLDDTPHMTVIGTARTSVVPDTAEIRLGVTVEKATAAEAWDASGAVAAALVETAKAAGIAAGDIATTGIELAREVDNQRQPDGTIKTVPGAFKASYRLRLTSKEIARVGAVTQALIAKGANEFEGIAFSMGDPRAVRDRLRAEAMRDARRQAESLAAAAGVQLGALLQVEPPTETVPPGATRRALAAAMPVEQGAEAMSVEVEAVYAIE